MRRVGEWAREGAEALCSLLSSEFAGRRAPHPNPVPARAGEGVVTRAAMPSRSPRLDAPGRHRAGRILRPGMSRITPAQIGTNRRITAAPETRQVARHLHRTMR